MSSNKLVDGDFLQYDAKIESIEDSLSFSVVSPQDLQAIAQEVDILNENSSSEETEEKLVGFYGRLETLHVNNEVDAIFEDMLDLRYSNDTSEKRAEKEAMIEKRLKRLWHQYSLSPENRAYVKAILHKIRGLGAEESDLDTSYLEITEDHPHKETKNGATALILCEAAYCFYKANTEEGKKLLAQLSSKEQNRLNAHLLVMGAEKIEFISTSDLSSYRENILRIVQALLGFASELAQNGAFCFYPSRDEVEMMFQEADDLS